MARSRTPRRYRYRFKGYSFKLTYKQKERLERCARLQGITPNKLIKRALGLYLDRHQGMLDDDAMVSENQLTLFNKGDYGTQLNLIDELEKDRG